MDLVDTKIIFHYVRRLGLPKIVVNQHNHGHSNRRSWLLKQLTSHLMNDSSLFALGNL